MAVRGGWCSVPVKLNVVDGIIHSTLSGVVTDEELLSLYRNPAVEAFTGTWREVVDGNAITDMAITAHGQMKLAEFVAGSMDRLRSGRVAMVAASDVTYGMFRMWELQREGMGYDVHVFRDSAAALSWVSGE